MKKSLLDVYIFMGLTAIFPIIDFLNGLFLTSGIPLPIGILYRFSYFLFLVIMILSEKIPKTKYTFITVSFILGNLLIFLLQCLFLQNPVQWIINDLSVFIKYFLWILIPYYIYQRKFTFQLICYEKLFIFISFLFTVSFLTPYLFGLGHQTYDHSNAGYKSFFFANNDTSFAFIVSITFTARELLNSVRRKWGCYLFLLFLLLAGNMLVLLLVSTKTGIIYGAIVCIYIFLKLIFKSRYYSAIHQFFIWLFCSFVIFWLFFRGIRYAAQMVAGTYERIVYFYYLYNGNLVRLISSARSDYLKGGMSCFLNDPNVIFTLFFGQGFEYRLAHFGRLGLIEMDFFDALFGTGIVGACLLVVMVGYFLFLTLEKGLFSIYNYVLFIAILYGFFAGHVFFSALSSTFLGLICGGIILSKKE